MEDNELTGKIIQAAMQIHTAPGPGLLESAYEACLEYELKMPSICETAMLGKATDHCGGITNVPTLHKQQQLVMSFLDFGFVVP